MYRASDQVDNEEYIEELQTAADRLDLTTDARSRAVDVFLSNVPEESRSKRATLASSLYVGALVAGDQRSQNDVAEAVGVSRLSVQQHWKDLIESVGLDAPDW
jgi:transcription initiation factor TFIIIB Brf1 subunit/transcription initiation factor TFIIB